MTVRQKLRAVFVASPIIVISTVVMASISVVVSMFSRTGRPQHRISRGWARSLLWAGGVTVEVEGLEKIAPGGSYVFAANHRSYMDVPCVLPYIPVQFRFLAVKYLFKVPFLGYHLKRAGHLMVDSANARESLRSMTDAARVIQEREISVLIFPEGSRAAIDEPLLPFKDGAAYVAIRAGVPIVPLAIVGAGEILHRDTLLVRSGKVKLRIGDPIETVHLPLSDRMALTRTLYERISQILETAHAPEQQPRKAALSR